MNNRVGPGRILPAKMRAGFEYLSYCISVEQGCGQTKCARDLDKDERRTKTAVLRAFDQYFMGERDHADTLFVAVPVDEDILEGMVTEVRATEHCEEQVVVDGDDDHFED